MVGGLDDGAFAHQTPTLRPTAKPDRSGGSGWSSSAASASARAMCRSGSGAAAQGGRLGDGSPEALGESAGVMAGSEAISTLAAASVGALMSAIAPGRADKPRRRWYARDELGVAPFVVRTGVDSRACGRLEMPTMQPKFLVRARVNTGRGSRNALSSFFDAPGRGAEPKTEADHHDLTVDGPNLVATG